MWLVNLAWVWSEGQQELSWSQPVSGALYQCCQGENAIHASLGLALLYGVCYPSSPPSIHFLTASLWDYEEQRSSSRRNTIIHICAKDYHKARNVADRLQSKPDTHITRLTADKGFTSFVCSLPPHLYNHSDTFNVYYSFPALCVHLNVYVIREKSSTLLL